ncbi:cobalamin biosynthesis protein [Devosia sp. XJ19-1]|uniref:Cobalamin biosynthesis protein n=1 Tax=Devosia ureilytica TaxID=2952754 RepID=A0A9Q4FTU4_9HYPH|nr:cobalamin biosynthesis protein [Devosia ureilytica]MCP8884912.1 cobalamin biosynthesis protein [Devosia ureilytica]MCP8888577.1 cobalamin biosynthesis protein [Devosia ureilytica]
MNSDSVDPASTVPALNRAGIIAGLGLRKLARLNEVLELLDASLSAAGFCRSDLAALTTLDAKSDHPALIGVAGLLNVPILPMRADRLDQQVPNPSERVFALARVPSVAEATALAFGPLLLEKQISANVTCALSRYGAGSSSAARASSTLATSSAGP